jgi:YD repeat-containing protein
MTLLARHDHTKARRRGCCLVACFLLIFPLSTQADEQRYVYDPLGRLYQAIDTAGNTATYHYDAVGNLLAITRTSTQPAPVITGITPSSGRAGETVTVTITGNNLLGATLSTTYAGLTISNITAAPTQITATFTLAETAAQGTATIQVTTASGSASVGFSIMPAPPALTLSPTEVSIEVGQSVTFTVRLAQTDPYDVQVTLALSDAAIAQVSTTQVTIPAGQLTQTVTVTGLAGGNTALIAKAAGKQAQAAITVYPALTGTILAYASTVSVAFPPTALPPLTQLTASPAVSVAFPTGSQPVTLGPVEAESVSVAFPTGSQPMVLGPVGATGVSVQIAEGLGAEMMGPVMAPSVSATISQ